MSGVCWGRQVVRWADPDPRVSFLRQVAAVQPLQLGKIGDGCRDHPRGIPHHIPGELPEDLRFPGTGRMLHDGSPFQLAGLDDGASGDELDKGSAQPFRKCGNDSLLKRFVAVAVAENPCEAWSFGISTPVSTFSRRSRRFP